LRGKKIAGAGIDVWDKEPPPVDHPLLQFDNVLATPHTAGMTREARANMGRIAAEQLVMTLDGKRPPRIVNPQVWPHMRNGSRRPSAFCRQDKLIRANQV
jgi:D-3-phosphoglycerate dehydrogenase